MKKLAIILGVFLVGITAQANSFINHTSSIRGYDGNAFIFQEGTIEFSVFPDGQFDFVYLGPQKGNRVIINSPNMNISFNAGYNYDAYVQYDMYGAVIQVEEVPIFYDYYGRIIQAGSVHIQYNDHRLVRIGGLYIHYNGGYYSHYTGYINAYNKRYVYHPWHVHYVRPIYTKVIVYDYPYRMHYHPVRYTYKDHNQYYNNRGRSNYTNGRREFYRPGSQTHLQDGRVVRNNDFDPNRRNTMIADGGRNNQNVRAQNTSSQTPNTTTGRNNGAARSNTETGRNTTSVKTRTNENTIINSNTNGRSNTSTPKPRNTAATPATVKSAPQGNSSVNTQPNTRVQNTKTSAPTNTTVRNTTGNTKKPAVNRSTRSTTVKPAATRSNNNNRATPSTTRGRG